MSKHAKLSPSGASRWMRCSGSVEAESGYPDDSNVHSREGTFAHDIAAKMLEDGEYIALGDSDGEFTCDAEMIKHLLVYTDAVLDTMFVEDADDGSLDIEHKVILTADLWGTADAVFLSGDGKHLHIFDLKYGAGNYVEVVDNPQCMIYALAHMATWPAECSGVEQVTMHIVQPRRTNSDGHAHRTWTVRHDDLEQWKHEHLGVAIDAVQFDPSLTPGDHCRFCKARSSCVALKDQAMAAAVAVFPKLEPTEPVQPPAPVSFSNSELGDLLSTASMVEMWISGLRKEAYERARNGKPIPGFKLVQKTGNRKWIDEATTEMELKCLGVEPMADPKLISPAEAERRLGKNKKAIAPLCHKPAGGIALVPDSHKLPALPENAASVFKTGSDK